MKDALQFVLIFNYINNYTVTYSNIYTYKELACCHFLFYRQMDLKTNLTRITFYGESIKICLIVRKILVLQFYVRTSLVFPHAQLTEVDCCRYCVNRCISNVVSIYPRFWIYWSHITQLLVFTRHVTLLVLRYDWLIAWFLTSHEILIPWQPRGRKI